MKKKEFTDLKTKDIEALKKLVLEKKTEAAKKKMETASNKEKNLKIFRNLRREIAQILTLIREKEILAKITAVKEEQK